MMNKNLNQLQSSLPNYLQQEIDCTKALLLSLESEKEALGSIDEKLITINSAKKQRLLDSLQQASQARLQLMVEHGIDNSSAGMKSFVGSERSNSNLDSLFEKLSLLAQQCFTENRQIGQLINRRTQFITQALSSLSPTIEGQGLTYSANGSAGKHGGLRNLGTI